MKARSRALGHYAGALLGGPTWGDRTAADTSGEPVGMPWQAWPLALLCATFLGIVLGGQLVPADNALWPRINAAAHALPLAASEAAFCLACAGFARFGVPWVLLLWLAPCVGLTGWRLLPMAPGPAMMMLGTCLLILPAMVLGWAGLAARLPPGLWNSAAVAGAGPITTCRLLLPRLIWRDLARLYGLALILCLLATP
jgi:hypothetical protein